MPSADQISDASVQRVRDKPWSSGEETQEKLAMEIDRGSGVFSVWKTETLIGG